jgi:glycosyltransferase involved in cell wall biosynthesis
MAIREVIVNGRSLSRRITGVERYTREILGCFPGQVQVVHPAGNVQGFAGHAWEQFILPGRVPRESILWSPANTGPLVVSNQVLTLSDLSPLEHPEWFKLTFAAWYRLLVPLLVRRVRRVITLSEHVRRKVITRFSIPVERVAAIPAGVDANRFRPLPRPADQGRYVLFVGSLEPRKNLPALLAAWKEIEKDFPQVSLILAGVAGRVFRPVHLPENVARLRFAGYVPDGSLPALYSGADVFVLPSFDEGFGLPVLEAMACGTPVVASTGGALPEVVGDAGLLFDPGDPLALAENLRQCLSVADLRNFLSERGRQRARQYSWQTASEKVWQTLQGEDEK